MFLSKNILWIIIIIAFGFHFIDTDILTGSFNATAKRIYSFITQYSSDGNISGSTSERIFYIKEGLKGFYKSPILGNGFKSFEAKYYHYSHNNYIEMLYCGGVFALIIYLSIYLNLILRIKNLGSDIKILIVFSVISLMALDIAAVTYLIKIVQYYICTLFVLTHIKRKKLNF